MANSTFSVELSMHEAPADAQERAATALVEPARAVGFKLSKRGDHELDYKPRPKYPLNLTLWQRGEKMTVKFEPAVDGGTRVMISGAVVRSKQAKASDPQHWSQALAGSEPA
jgi:hypothetical protein